MLAEHIPTARQQDFAVQFVVGHGIQRRAAFEHLEPVGGHENGAGGGIIAVVRPPDPLHQALHRLGRADLDHQFHIAPVEPQIQRSRWRRRRGVLPAAMAASTFWRASRAREP